MGGRQRSRRIVAVDWDTRTLRVVDAQLGKRGVEIGRLLSVPIPHDVDPMEPRSIGELIRRTLDQEGIGTRHAVVDVPRDQAILKTLSLPTAKPDELPGMVAIQIAKELPFPVAEATVDFTVNPTRQDGSVGEVLVAAVRREQLEYLAAVFSAAGLKLDRIGLRPYANAVSVEALLKPTIPERVVFIDVRPTFMEIDVLHDAVLSFSRSASVAIPDGGTTSDAPLLSIDAGRSTDTVDVDLDDADSPLARGDGASPGEVTRSDRELDPVVRSLMLEVTRSIEAYRAADPGARIDHVVIGGDVGVEEALAEAIQNRLDVTTQLYNPASTFGWEPDEGAEACAFAASLGLALGHEEDGTLHFDFLHPKRVVSAARKRLRKAPLAAAVGVVFVAAAGVGFAQYTKPGRQRMARLEAEIADLEEASKENKKFLDLVDRIVEFDEGQYVWVDVLYEIISLLPSNQELVIGHIELDQADREVTLKTRTNRSDTPTQIVRKLREYRREGRDGPCFEAEMGAMTEKKGEKYPYYQDIWITLKDDGSAPRAAGGKRPPARGGRR